MKYDSQSEGFLSLLDPKAPAFTFQTFDDDKGRRNPALLNVLHGSLPSQNEKLRRLNRRGAGIFVTINETDGCARKAENVIRVRAIWQDDDQGYDGVFPLPPSVVVSTSPGKYQRLWLADGLSKEDFKGLMRTMVAEYGSDKNAADISRVLRLPAFYHNKAEPYLVSIAEAPGKRYTRDELLKAFPPPKKIPSPPSSFISKSCEHAGSEEAYRISSALKMIDPDTYDTWLSVGMILHAAYQGGADGLCLWIDWASASKKFNRKEHRYKWTTFGKTEGRALGLGTLFRFADEALYGD
jgi:hypothetical protein